MTPFSSVAMLEKWALLKILGDDFPRIGSADVDDGNLGGHDRLLAGKRFSALARDGAHHGNCGTERSEMR
jgi:hypothetical protein